MEIARGTDLPDLLASLGYTVTRIGRYYSTKEMDSLRIKNRRTWYRYSERVGGDAITFLQHFCGRSFPEAVEDLLAFHGRARDAPAERSRQTEQAPELPKPFALPPRHTDARRVYAYLKKRGVSPQIIRSFISAGLLYEDSEHHNCVFIGFQGERPRYGALRGTLSQSAFKGDIPGSDKRFSFAVPRQAGSRGTLCVFECAIDALSYLTIIKAKGQDWRQANCLSLAGIYQPRENGQIKFPLALDQYLKDNPHIETVVLCLDSDEVGRAASRAISDRLEGYTVIDNPPRGAKDYNDLLRQRQRAAELRTHRHGENR